MRRLVLIGLALLVAGPTVLAVRPEDAIVPELLAGTVGGYGGAVLGATTLAWAFSLGATGWESIVRVILGGYLGFYAGTVVGSSLGVVAAGALFGVEGNVRLAFLGAAVGTAGAFGVAFSFQTPETILPFAPVAAAVGATAGFNVNARPRK